MIWGSGPTERHICASSEPRDDSSFEGYHKVFDVEKGVAYDLDANEAGDGIALTPDGLCHHCSVMINNDKVDRRVHSCSYVSGTKQTTYSSLV
jgi:hypothetical protein